MKNLLTLICGCLILTFGAACNSGTENLSPTAVFKVFVTASEKNDVNLIKQNLSKASVKMLEDSAKSNKLSIDEVIKNQLLLASNKEFPETRDEKIEGDTATLEIRNTNTQTWDKVFFVNEEKHWKIALDKFVAESLKK